MVRIWREMGDAPLIILEYEKEDFLILSHGKQLELKGGPNGMVFK